MSIEVILLFLAVFATRPEMVQNLARIISLGEWQSRRLSADTMAALGLKGSPKLSKVLVSCGVPLRRVEMALSGAKNAAGHLSWVAGLDGDISPILEQGDSLFYTSCQRTGGMLNVVSDDVPFWGQSLFLWVIGRPQSEDTLGFRARAKLRVLYRDSTCEEVAGLYVDRPYGQYNLLLEEMSVLQEWWVGWLEAGGHRVCPIFFPPVWARDPGAGSDFEEQYGGRYTPLYCPSSRGGYQDTTGGRPWISFMTPADGCQLSLVQLYKARTKLAGVYLEGLEAYACNPQRGGIILSREEVFEPRTPLTEVQKALVDEFRGLYGRPWARVEPFVTGGIYLPLSPTEGGEDRGVAYVRWSQDVNILVYVEGHSLGDHVVHPYEGCLTVVISVPELGFAEAVELPTLRREEGLLEVVRPGGDTDLWAAADELPILERKLDHLGLPYWEVLMPFQYEEGDAGPWAAADCIRGEPEDDTDFDAVEF